MRNNLFKHTLVALALFVAGICQLQAARAQSTSRTTRSMNEGASCPVCSGREPTPVAVQIGSRLQPVGIEGTVSPSKKKKRHEILFSLSSADILIGITGFIV